MFFFPAQYMVLGLAPHPNVCRLIAAPVVMPDGASTALVLPRCSMDLVDFPACDMTVVKVLSLFRQAALGLAHCHGQGVYHLDVKLENLLLAPDMETVLICDFGLSHVSRLDKCTDLCRGTTEYMAPECAQDTGCFDASKADVWSLGMSLIAFVARGFPWDSPLPSSVRFCEWRSRCRGSRCSWLLESMAKDTLTPCVFAGWPHAKQLYEVLEGMLEILPEHRLPMDFVASELGRLHELAK